MAKLRANVPRFDPYKNFNFRVKWEGRFVAGVTKISALKRTTEVIEARDGSDPNKTRRLPGRTTYEAITLERGVSHDTEFEQWASAVASFGSGSGGGSAPPSFRKDIVINVYNDAGELALAYKVFRCWVSEYQALPDLDANANVVVIEHIKLENEGWERDASVAAPARRRSSRRPSPAES